MQSLTHPQPDPVSATADWQSFKRSRDSLGGNRFELEAFDGANLTVKVAVSVYCSV